jgi:predicted alpha/beta hydrolase
VAGQRGTARAADGHELAVTRFAAEGASAGTLALSGAMGVRQDFYAPLASFYAANGYHVLTFDYRGMGWSRNARLRGFEADVSIWAERDLNAMLHEARKPAPGLPLYVLGHSLGGQILGVAPDNAMVRAAVTVTAGSGYYRYNDRIPLQVRTFWFAAIPMLTPLFGYFPGKALRMVGDLPRGVAWQWRKWCLDPEYLLCEGPRYRAAFDRVKAPVISYSFEDDTIITKPAIDHLHTLYRAARVERRHVSPADVGEERIGHFGFFSERSRGTFWKESLEWLRAKA